MKLFTIALMLCIRQGISAQILKIMETTNNTAAVVTVINRYFKGIETGDTVLLGQTFHSDALLFGDINGVPYAKTRNEYLSGVANRVSPDKSGQPFEAEILSVEVINSIATAKLHVRMYAFNYYNFLTLHETEKGKWLIVNKTLTNVID
ncbi:nuclear transport factor 2 family protein [Fluviicola chungangensis]|uniref:Nuclear transport factor 2 family protein n=1 Tax=Fluviicola chungangensis TaxID=2597671 RepID=A0A556MJK6_9FLAO|nr:nuclear transport factor 2 family protein [Fluviicola chungangensis]TSJ40088.1 nuclear transport factor 2 family protein [Fluviicola chungangensis]